MKKNLLTLLLLSFMALSSAFAQSRTITGIVTSADDGQSFPGVSVKVTGSTVGTQTNAQGMYTISVPANAKSLTISYVGYVTQVAVIGTKSVINIKLAPDAKSLNEVVVVGYGTGIKNANVVGTTSTVASKEIEDKPVANVFDALQGKVAGLQVLTSSGEPTATPTLQLHGNGSLGASSTPLIVMDGIPVDPGTILSLNPDDFDDITVLKDASTLSIYGSRAANGVIYLTSKKGSNNKPASISITTQLSDNALASTDLYKSFLNRQQYIDFEVATGAQSLATINSAIAGLDVKDADVQWYKVLFKQHTQTYQSNVAVSGGSAKTTYYVSGGYFKADGLAYRSGYDRYTLRSNITSDVNDWIRFNLSLSGGYDERSTNPYGTNNLNRGLGLLNQPYYSPVDLNGNNYDNIPGLARYHPNYLANKIIDPANNTQFNPSGFIQLTPIKGLTIKSQGGMDAFDYRESSIREPSYAGSLYNGSVQEIFTRGVSKTFTNTAEYRFSLLKQHNFIVLAGQEYTDGSQKAFSAVTTGQVDDRIVTLDAGGTGKNASSRTVVGGGTPDSDYSYHSLFGSLDYNYNEKYLLRGTLRQDKSSRFGVNNRSALFYSVGASWQAKKEDFFKNINWIDELKLTVSTGTLGNSAIGNYDALATVGSLTYATQTGAGIAAPGNPNLGWEQQQLTTFAVQTSLFDRVRIEASYYIRNTSNMLISVPYAYTSGFGSVTTNTGTLENKGFDVDVEFDAYKSRTHKAVFTPYFRFNVNHDKITQLFQGKDYYVLANTGVAWVVGQPVSFLYPIFAGVSSASGLPMWYNPGSTIAQTNKDPNNVTNNFNATTLQQNTGIRRYPTFQGSFGFSGQYEGFTIEANFNFVKGKSLINNDRYFFENPSAFPTYNQSNRVLDYWKKPGDVTLFPKYGQQFTQFDSRLIEDASFIRLKNLTLGYSIPQSILKRTKAVKGFRVFLTGRDLLTWTKYLGPDPEVDSNLSLGANPNTKQYSLGVQVTF